jgi:multicomponent K+:H+ antiporter subunit E
VLKLAATVAHDIVVSNWEVASIVLAPRTRRGHSGFVEIPLELRHPTGLALLACIITATPGTSWAKYDSSSSTLTMHIFDLVDDELVVRTIKERYERRLLEIFQ